MTDKKSKSNWPVDAQILASLRSGESISGAELAQTLGISRTAIWARIEELRLLGYEISASPHTGYRLDHVPDVLHADDLLSRVGPKVLVGRDIRVFQETTSTNDLIDKFARAGVPEGAVVFAESQTKGRGRLGRKWLSPHGKGLWFSVLLRPQMSPQETTRLTVTAATALNRAIITHTGLPAEIKWPNDILLRGRKLAGILTEMQAETDRVKYLILGIGIDVNLTTQDYPSALRSTATSLRIESGQMMDRADLAAVVLSELDRDYHRVCNGQFTAIADEWATQCTTLGKNLRLQTGSRTLSGHAESLDPDGALLLRTQHGHLERIVGGDVIVEK